MSALPPAEPSTPPVPPAPRGRAVRVVLFIVAVLLLALALAMAWRAQQRIQSVEQELVRRQQSSQEQATEARVLARQAQDSARDAAAKVALLQARVSEAAAQRGQIDDLVQLLSRSRDDNAAIEVEAALRVALQHSAITGSAGPLVAALKQAEDRLARIDQPRLEGVRRAIARDLDRARAVSIVDVASLNIKLDEAVRLVDDLPLVASAPRQATRRLRAAAPAASAASDAAADTRWPWLELTGQWLSGVWDEARSLVRVTRIESPEAMLVAPDQGFFLRENLKLRLLDARLALLSRQFDIARSDLRRVQSTLERFFDRGARPTAALLDIVAQVAERSHHVQLPRPDETLAALASLNAGR